MKIEFPDLPLEEANLLARYHGEKPPAPDWFKAAIETPFEERFVAVQGAQIRFQDYGGADKPGLLLCHGNGAHARWFDYIAPALNEAYHVVSMSFSGMGGSDWRDAYGFKMLGDEQIAVCEAAGFFDKSVPPVIIAHSFGGFATLHMAERFGDRFSGVVIVDSGLRPPEDEWEGPPRTSRGNRTYASLQAALALFRLMPPQTCANHYLADYIARHSIKQVQNEAGQTGWTWKFDPHNLLNFDHDDAVPATLDNIPCRIAMMRGQDSILVSDRIWEHMRSLRPGMDMTSIPDAQHHVMLDQPLAFIEAVKAQLNRWDY